MVGRHRDNIMCCYDQNFPPCRVRALALSLDLRDVHFQNFNWFQRIVLSFQLTFHLCPFPSLLFCLPRRFHNRSKHWFGRTEVKSESLSALEWLESFLTDDLYIYIYKASHSTVHTPASRHQQPSYLLWWMNCVLGHSETLTIPGQTNVPLPDPQASRMETLRYVP